jgi:Kdo2-lipid IVA lauroyltransferase/acyltransferase
MYYIVYSFLWILSLLPLRVLHFLADCIYVLVFYVFGYRKELVFRNMKQAYPQKSDEEIKKLAKKFYHSFIDSLIESIKLFSQGKTFLDRHVQMDVSVLNQLAAENKSCQMHACHQFNWEYLNLALVYRMKQPLVAVYMPIKAKALNKIFYDLRTRYGTVMLPATEMKNKFTAWRNRLHVLTLVADQNPGNPNNAYWLSFFNKTTPFIKGPERYAREKACPVVLTYSKIIKRGHYSMHFELLTNDASALPEGELTRLYVKRITEIINEQPYNWLWSHRRWKHEWKPEYADFEIKE